MPEMYAHRHALTHTDTCTDVHTHGTQGCDQINGRGDWCVKCVFLAQIVPTPSAAVLKGSLTTAFVSHLSSLRLTSCLRQLRLSEKLPNLFSNEAILLELLNVFWHN